MWTIPLTQTLVYVCCMHSEVVYCLFYSFFQDGLKTADKLKQYIEKLAADLYNVSTSHFNLKNKFWSKPFYLSLFIRYTWCKHILLIFFPLLKLNCTSVLDTVLLFFSMIPWSDKSHSALANSIQKNFKCSSWMSAFFCMSYAVCVSKLFIFAYIYDLDKTNTRWREKAAHGFKRSH